MEVSAYFYPTSWQFSNSLVSDTPHADGYEYITKYWKEKRVKTNSPRDLDESFTFPYVRTSRAPFGLFLCSTYLTQSVGVVKKCSGTETALSYRTLSKGLYLSIFQLREYREEREIQHPRKRKQSVSSTSRIECTCAVVNLHHLDPLKFVESAG
jgi:hypothetical protein